MLSLLLTTNCILCLFLLQLISVQRAKSAKVCCELTGCFNDKPPFDKLPLPICSDSQKYAPLFNLYTKSNPETPYLITPSHLPRNFSIWTKTYFLAHGWNSNGDKGWIITMKDELLKKENVNVVVINWTSLSNFPDYSKAASNVRTAGTHAGLVMENIRKGNGKTHFWCIGHSVGAHLCAHAGDYIRIDRITGLDPAGPGFEVSTDLTIGLHQESADFVDVMHTNDLYGTVRPLGHLDFYPNKGTRQPGCFTNSCSHSMAHSFFIESIKIDCFVAPMLCKDHTNLPKSCKACKGCALMGYGADRSTLNSGMMYLQTKSKEPYCLS